MVVVTSRRKPRTRTGKLKGVGRIAGRKIAYVAWDDGTMSEYTLTEFRKRFGVGAAGLPTGTRVAEGKS